MEHPVRHPAIVDHTYAGAGLSTVDDVSLHSCASFAKEANVTDPSGESTGRHRAERADGSGDGPRRPPGPQPEAGDTWSDPVPPPAPTTTRQWWHRRRELLVLALPIVVVIAYAVLRDPASTGPALALPTGSTITASVGVNPATASATAGPTPTPSPTRTPTPPPTVGPTTTTATQSAGPPTTTAPVWTTETIEATFVFRLGDSVSTNRTRLHLQGDGDLVIIDEVGTVRWRSNTAGTGNTAVFQDDGHFVVYDRDQRAVWTSGTAGRPGAVLVIAADGDVDIVHNGTVVWSSNTAH